MRTTFLGVPSCLSLVVLGAACGTTVSGSTSTGSSATAASGGTTASGSTAASGSTTTGGGAGGGTTTGSSTVTGSGGGATCAGSASPSSCAACCKNTYGDGISLIDYDCACSANASCGAVCGESWICGPNMPPSDACVVCFEKVLAPGGSCAADPMFSQSCSKPSPCGELAACLASCPGN